MAVKPLVPGSVEDTVAELMFEPCAGMAMRVLLLDGAMDAEEVAAKSVMVMSGYNINHTPIEVMMGLEYLRGKGLVSDDSHNFWLNPAGVAVAEKLWGMNLAITGREPHQSYRSNI